jgi:hypothetical protein
VNAFLDYAAEILRSLTVLRSVEAEGKSAPHRPS